MRWVIVPVLAAGAALFGAALLERVPARADGPCGTPHDSLDAQEQQFVQLVEAWRDQHLTYSTPLEISGALNAAAAWFAQWQVDHGAPGGHIDSYGRSWIQRAIDCGYLGTTSGGLLYTNGSGEGIRAYASSQPLTVPASTAAADITYPGSGVWAETPSSSLPFKCVGAARAASSDGKRVAWVIVIAQYPASSACPSSGAGSPSATPSQGASATPSATPSPTPRPTSSPTPPPRGDGISITLWAGWNLVMLPAGPVESVLGRAAGCFEAVYQFDGTGWLRYVPGGPGYVNTLGSVQPGPAWVKGSAANCGTILL